MDAEALFGHVNDAIRKLATDGASSEAWEFLCECPDVECHAMVSLTLLEFDELRAAYPPQPVLATHLDGHGSVDGADTHQQLAMLRILYGASSAALDAFRAADNPVDEQLVADLETMVERTRTEIERLAAHLASDTQHNGGGRETEESRVAD
jgi:hypothetical protein